MLQVVMSMGRIFSARPGPVLKHINQSRHVKARLSKFNFARFGRFQKFQLHLFNYRENHAKTRIFNENLINQIEIP